MILLEDLQGKPVAELCTEHQISQAQYDQWRDQLLANAAKVFEVQQQSQREARLAQQNARLKTFGGELTLKFKQSEAVLGVSRLKAPLVAQRNGAFANGVKSSKLSLRSGVIAESGPTCALSRSVRSTRSGF
jgi:transposase